MFTSTYLSTQQTSKLRAIVLKSHHNRAKPRAIRSDLNKSRQESQFSTKSYSDSLQRAFNRAKMQVFFNPDMTNFVTLTYKGSDHTPEQVLADVKAFVRQQRTRDFSTAAQPTGQGCGKVDAKYIYVMEYQKRGSIHVHMISNRFFRTHKNKNGYDSITDWTHGFSSVLTIADFDSNFKSYLYLFKYMRKAQRIGKSFLHASRNLNNFKQMTEELDYSATSELSREYSEAIFDDGSKFHFYRYFLNYDIMKLSLNNKLGAKKNDRSDSNNLQGQR